MKTTAWIGGRRPREAATLRLFCFPYAGAGSVIYRDWPAHLPDTIDVCPIEPPQRLTRQGTPYFATISEFVGALDEALGNDLLDLPVALFGYSLGALIAFEWARWLRRRRHIEPRLLMVAACRPPHAPRRPGLSALPERAFIRAVEERFGAFDPRIKSEPELMQRIGAMTRADLRLLDQYRYQEDVPLACPIHAFGGSHDPATEGSFLEAWRVHTLGAFGVHTYEGGHFFMREHGSALAKDVTDLMLRYGNVAGSPPGDAPRHGATARNASTHNF